MSKSKGKSPEQAFKAAAAKIPQPKPQPQAKPARITAPEIIAVSLAKQANGEVLRWRINEANGELIVLLKDGRKLYGRFD